MRKSLATFLLVAAALSAATSAESATITLTEATTASISGTTSVTTPFVTAQTNSFSASTNKPASSASGDTDSYALTSLSNFYLEDLAIASASGEFGKATTNAISIPSLSAAVLITPAIGTDLASAAISDDFSFTIDSATSFSFTGRQATTGSAADISGSGFGLFEGTDATGTPIAVPAPSLSGAFSFSGILAPGSYFLSAQANLQDGTFNGVDAGTFNGTATFLINTVSGGNLLVPTNNGGSGSSTSGTPVNAPLTAAFSPRSSPIYLMVATPEPSTWTMLVIGAASLLISGLRRRRF